MAHFHSATRTVVFQWAFIGPVDRDLRRLVEQVCEQPISSDSGSLVRGRIALPLEGSLAAYAEISMLTVPSRHPSLWKQAVGKADIVVGLIEGGYPRSEADQLVWAAQPDAVVQRARGVAEADGGAPPKLSLLTRTSSFLLDNEGSSVSALRRFLMEQSSAALRAAEPSRAKRPAHMLGC